MECSGSRRAAEAREGIAAAKDRRFLLLKAVGCDETWQYRHADCPNGNVHGHQRNGFRPSTAKPMSHRKGNIGNKRNEEDFPSEAAVFACWLQSIAAHAEKCENGTHAKKHRIENRNVYCKRQKFGIGMQDCNRESAYEEDRQHRNRYRQRPRPEKPT